MNFEKPREDKIGEQIGLVVGRSSRHLSIHHDDAAWLVRVAQAARELRDAVIQRPDDVVPTPPNSDLAKATGGPFMDLSILLREEA